MRVEPNPGVWHFGDNREGCFDATAKHMKVISHTEDKGKWVVRDEEGEYKGEKNEYADLKLMDQTSLPVVHVKIELDQQKIG